RGIQSETLSSGGSAHRLKAELRTTRLVFHLFSVNRSSARWKSRRQTVRLKVTTTTAITKVLAASRGKLACSVAVLIWAPSLHVRKTSPRKVTYSDTMLAFQAPPAAVTHPVTRQGKIAGRYSTR